MLLCLVGIRKNYKIFSYILLLTILFLFPPAWAFANNSALNIHIRNGEKYTILLDEEPKFLFSNNELILVSLKDIKIFPSDEVEKITFEAIEMANIRYTTHIGPIVSADNVAIRISNLPQNSWVRVYTIEGILFAALSSDENGNITIPLLGSSKTTYVIKTTNLTFKLLVK